MQRTRRVRKSLQAHALLVLVVLLLGGWPQHPVAAQNALDADNGSGKQLGAESSTRVGCTVGFFRSCTTAAIPAHPTRHRIYVAPQDPHSIIQVFDVTGVRVYYSQTGWLPKTSTYINGLYNWYYLKLTARDVIFVDAEIASL